MLLMLHTPAALKYAVTDILLTMSWLRHCVGIVTWCDFHHTLCMHVHRLSLSVSSSDTEAMQIPEDDHRRHFMPK